MTFRIKQGKHRAWPPLLGLWFNKKRLRRKVQFDITAKYDVGNDDTNKLFGFGYFWHHHKNSIRFGWRYDGSHIIISTYCYDHGQRKITDLAKLHFNRWYGLEITITPTHYQLRIGELYTGWELAKIEVPKTHNKKWSYPLGLYFGGNKPAPHNISVTIKKHSSCSILKSSSRHPQPAK